MEAKERIIDEDEKLCCSLIGKYPFKNVRDVIDEACIHQDEVSVKVGRKEVVDFVLSGECITRAKLKEWGLWK